jgi:hypothetical protein
MTKANQRVIRWNSGPTKLIQAPPSPRTSVLNKRVPRKNVKLGPRSWTSNASLVGLGGLGKTLVQNADIELDNPKSESHREYASIGRDGVRKEGEEAIWRPVTRQEQYSTRPDWLKAHINRSYIGPFESETPGISVPFWDVE